MRVGEQLEFAFEPENPHDPEAVAIFRGNAKLGYIPSAENSRISLLGFFGHGAILECRVLQVSPEAKPWEQVRVGVFLRDARS